MKKIGLLGGMSWESSLEYYRIINEEVKRKLGGTHSAKCVLNSLDFGEIEGLQHQNEWDRLAELMVIEVNNLKNAGSDFIVICTNTMHIMATEIEERTGLHVLHIADTTGDVIKKAGLDTIGLLGTRFTMEGNFYKKRLKDNYGVNTITPDENDRKIIHQVIYQELVKGELNEESRLQYLEIIDKLRKKGAQGVILGCTEIPLLIKQDRSSLTIFDTTTIHAKAAVEFALKDNDAVIKDKGGN